MTVVRHHILSLSGMPGEGGRSGEAVSTRWRTKFPLFNLFETSLHPFFCGPAGRPSESVASSRPPVSQDMMPDIQERLVRALPERYEIVRKIGVGGMGSVFLADDRKLGRKVAIKVMNPELSATVTGDRFHREIRIAAGLAHPHIVPVHDSGEADDLLFFVMRFQDGESLRALIDREGPLPIDRVLSIARDVSEGLSYAHAQDVVHRDIKPANILLTGRHALIADFGVARAVEKATSVDPSVTSSPLGTPLYMSPEQASGSPEIDGRADVYSLGCVMYEMLTGKAPFRSKSPVGVLAGHLRSPVPAVREDRPDVPQPLAEIVSRALAKSPDDRFENAESMQLALEAAQSGHGGKGLGLRDRWRWLSRRTRRVVGATAFSAAVACLVFAFLLWPPGPPSPDPSSMVVIPFRGPGATAEEEVLMVALADELTRQLDRWDSVSAVPQIALSGTRFDMGFDTPILERIEDGLALARAVGAGTVVALSALAQGDSVLFSADLLGVRNGRRRGRAVEARAGPGDVSGAAMTLANLVLGLGGTAAEVSRLREQSTVPEALIANEAGRRALERWSLTEAQQNFRRATELDPGFAMAQHYLALTCYWQWEEGLATVDDVGEEIPLASTLARRNSPGLPMRDSLHILAFNRFQAGDYESARAHYRTLLERDSADVYAWFLQGSVEFYDPWLTESSTGTLSPRSNLNQARRSLEEAVRLSPGFHGAYGMVFKIATSVARAADRVSAPGFELPRGEFFPPWAQPGTPLQAEAFWPAYLDSLVWFDDDSWAAVPDSLASSGADLLLGESLGVLRRWAAFEPDQARPQRELAQWALFLRDRLRAPVPPARIDSLTEEAFRYASRALSLSADTTQYELFELANLHLAMGEVEEARSVWTTAVEWQSGISDGGISSASANVPLFLGRPNEALRLLEAEPARSHFYLDTVTGGLVDDGGGESLVQRLRILGATGQSGPGLDDAISQLMDLWASGPGRTQEEMALLKRQNAPRIAIALRLSPAMLESWIANLELEDPLWDLLRSESEEGQRALLEAAMDPGHPEIGDLSRTYILGKMAQQVGDHTGALRLFSRLDSLAFEIRVRDAGWGLLALSYIDRGLSYEAAGDPGKAIEFYTRFSEAWSEPDGSHELIRTARRRLDDLSQETQTRGG